MTLLKDNDVPPNDLRNVRNYLTGETKRSSDTVRSILTTFAREYIDSKFDIDLLEAAWDYCGPIDTFLLKNAVHVGMAHQNCGEFVYFVLAENEPGFRSRKITITYESTLNYRFLIGNPDSTKLDQRCYEGFAIPSDNTLFLVGFDRTAHWDLIYFILQPPGTRNMDGVVLLGMQTCTLRNRGALSGLAVGRRTVLIPHSDWLKAGGDQYNLSQAAAEWLREDRAFRVQLAEHIEDDEP